MRQTYDQAQEVIEDGNRLRDHPGDDPERQSDDNPCADGEKGAFMHVLGVSEETDINIFRADVAVDHTCNNNLGRELALGFIQERGSKEEKNCTVGMATPYATFAVTGAVEESAGDLTSFPP